MSRKQVTGAVLAFLSVPLWLVLIDAVSYHVTNRSNGSLISSGRRREYVLYVPRGYDRAHPTPLVISMHGAGGWPVQQLTVSGWNRLADTQGFIVVYPSAATGAGPRIWHVDTGDALAQDVRFIGELKHD